MADRKAILLRLDPELAAAITRWAEHEVRSTNAQIEYLLRAALVASDRIEAPDPGPA